MASRKTLNPASLELNEVRGKQVPLKLIKESRKNVRTSVGKDAVYLRIPFWTSRKQQQKLRAWCIQWLQNKHQKTGLLNSLQKRSIRDGSIISLPQERLSVRVSHADRKSGKGTIRANTVFLDLPEGLGLEDEQNLCRKMINNLLCKRYQPAFERRVREINARFFKQQVTSVKLRYNYSKWGSCTTNQQISLSTRLIFAPQDVIDYVIVHELAHLIEMNHSDRFWDIVGKIIPDYRDQEKWLRENAWQCDY
jgi:predicted metal-dependent hydrolase